MRKLWLSIVLLLAVLTPAPVRAQVTYTPNINLALPPYAYPNWNTIVNQNFTKLDTVIGALQNPYLGNWINTTTYTTGVLVSYTGNVYISVLGPNTNNNPVTATTYWVCLSCGSGGGGGGSGTVGNGSPLAVPTYQTTPGTVVTGNPNLYELNGNLTNTQINTFLGSLSSNSTVIIPQGVPNQVLVNSNGVTFIDARLGAMYYPVSQASVSCDARQVNIVMTQGSATAYANFSTLSANDIGKTIPVTGAVSGVPTVFLPTLTGTVTATVTAYSVSSNVVTLTSNNQYVVGMRVNFSGFNVAAFLNGKQGTVTSASSSQFSVSGFTTANASTTADNGSSQGDQALTLSTAAPFSVGEQTVVGTDNQSAMNNLMANLSGSKVVGQLPAGCEILTSVVSVNQGQSLIGQSPSTSIVHSMPGQDTFASPDVANTSFGQAGQVFGNMGGTMDNSIDPTRPWNLVKANGTTVAQAPLYRPLDTQGFNTNKPTAPQWASWASKYQPSQLGTASITGGSATMCVPNTYYSRLVQGWSIGFRDTPTPYQGTVSALNAGACPAGSTGATLSPAMTNSSAYTIAQAEFVTAPAIQSLAVALPAGTLTYPFTVTLNLPTAPSPMAYGGFSTHGHIKIGSDEYDYVGKSALAPWTITIYHGPATTPGWAVGTDIFPMNPCYARYETPYPVYPTINSGDSTPSGAVPFPNLCGGNYFISMPQVNGNVNAGVGISSGNLSNILISTTNNNNSNNTGVIYAAGNTAPYNTTIDNIHSAGTTYGYSQGPASYGQHGVSLVGPTGSGTYITNTNFNASYPFILADAQNGKVVNNQSTTTIYNQWDGSTVGAGTYLTAGYTSDEQTGGTVTNVAGYTFDTLTAEPENGTHAEIPPNADLNIANAKYINVYFEGAQTIFGGAGQQFDNGQLAALNTLPNIIYGNNIAIGMTSGTFGGVEGAPNNTYGIDNTLNWGNFNRAAAYGGDDAATGPVIGQLPGSEASFDGADNGSVEDGILGSAWYMNKKAGFISAAEFTTQGNIDVGPFTYSATYDATSPTYASAGCNVTTGGGCYPTHFDGFDGGIYVGPWNRITNAKYDVTVAVKTPAGNNSFTFFVNVVGPGGTTQCAYPLGKTVTSKTIPTTNNWTYGKLQADLTDPGLTGCNFQIGFANSATNTLLQVAYADFEPIKNIVSLPEVSFSTGAACPSYALPGDMLGSDATNFYACGPSNTVLANPWGGGGGGGGGTGTVTSVGLVVPSWLTVTNSPVTTSGNITVGAAGSQTSHQVIGTCGTATSFAPCTLVAADIPSLPYITAGTGDVSFSAGGTGGSVATTVNAINGGTSFKTMASGVLCNTTGTGQLSPCTSINLTGPIVAGVATITPASSITFNAGVANTFFLTLSSNTTAALTNATVGQELYFEITQAASGGPYTLTWPNNFLGFPAVTTTASGITTYGGRYDGTSVVAAGYNAAQCDLGPTSGVVACGGAYKGFVAVAAGTSPVLTVNTTAVATGSVILVQPAPYATIPSVTCGTSIPSGPLTPETLVAGTSFQILVPGTITGNYCMTYTVVNP